VRSGPYTARAACVMLAALGLQATLLAHTRGGDALGLTSGLAHPLSGLDHVLAMIAVGVWGAQLGAPAIWLLPVTFPIVMAVGGAVGLLGLQLPGLEIAIALSAVALGAAVLGETRPKLWAAATLVAFFAIFHGNAHGHELPAGANGILFSIGFVTATGTLHAAGIALGLAHRWPAGRTALRAAGGAISIAGLVFLWSACSSRPVSEPGATGTTGTNGDSSSSPEIERIAEEAYIYAYPMIAMYEVMYESSVDTTSALYRAPFNRIWSEARVFTPKDTATVTPNSDTADSMVQLDLRTEPMVLCVPAIPRDRYYSVQLVDMYRFNYAYIGSRTTGNRGGCYMVTGPNWKGDAPPAIGTIFHAETEFSLAIYRLELFGSADVGTAKVIQAQYRVEPLSSFAKQRPPAAPAKPDFPAYSNDAVGIGFIRYLNFLLQFCPVVPEEEQMRARFAAIGIAPGKPFAAGTLPDRRRAAIERGVARASERIRQRSETLRAGMDANGWSVAAPFGDRAFYHLDYLLRAAAVRAGLSGIDGAETLYAVATVDSDNEDLDGSKYRYTIRFGPEHLPPVHAFWSLTIYDGVTQRLVPNPIHRYRIDSSTLPTLRTHLDRSFAIEIQRDSPMSKTAANWLPAPNGPICLVMRLYWPKTEALDGMWKPPPIQRQPR